MVGHHSRNRPSKTLCRVAGRTNSTCLFLPHQPSHHRHRIFRIRPLRPRRRAIRHLPLHIHNHQPRRPSAITLLRRPVHIINQHRHRQFQLSYTSGRRERSILNRLRCRYLRPLPVRLLINRMCLTHIHQKKFRTIFIFVVKLFQAAGLVTKRRSSVRRKDQYHRPLPLERRKPHLLITNLSHCLPIRPFFNRQPRELKIRSRFPNRNRPTPRRPRRRPQQKPNNRHPNKKYKKTI